MTDAFDFPKPDLTKGPKGTEISIKDELPHPEDGKDAERLRDHFDKTLCSTHASTITPLDLSKAFVDHSYAKEVERRIKAMNPHELCDALKVIEEALTPGGAPYNALVKAFREKGKSPEDGIQLFRQRLIENRLELERLLAEGKSVPAGTDPIRDAMAQGIGEQVKFVVSSFLISHQIIAASKPLRTKDHAKSKAQQYVVPPVTLQSHPMVEMGHSAVFTNELPSITTTASPNYSVGTTPEQKIVDEATAMDVQGVRAEKAKEQHTALVEEKTAKDYVHQIKEYLRLINERIHPVKLDVDDYMTSPRELAAKLVYLRAVFDALTVSGREHPEMGHAMAPIPSAA